MAGLTTLLTATNKVWLTLCGRTLRVSDNYIWNSGPNPLHLLPSLKKQGYKVMAGFEPAHSGFADRCLTTWLHHHSGIITG